MSILESLFAGARAFVKELVTVATDAVKVVLREIDHSSFGRAATELVKGVTARYFRSAADLAAEEREIAMKFRRDGRHSASDLDRLDEIEKAREELKEQIQKQKASEAAEEFRESKDDVLSAPVSDDETSAAIGILSTKECPNCGGAMRIRQSGIKEKSHRRRFYWLCVTNPGKCPTVKIDIEAMRGKVLRRPDPNFDLSEQERRDIWTRRDVLVETAGRLRKNLGDEDKQVICPVHLLPMKLLEKPNADGLLLSTYEYRCLSVDSTGRACQHKVSLESFPQVSETLKRSEGVGIIRH